MGIKFPAARAKRNPNFKAGYFGSLVFALLGGTLLAPRHSGTEAYLIALTFVLLVGATCFAVGTRRSSPGWIKMAVILNLLAPFLFILVMAVMEFASR